MSCNGNNDGDDRIGDDLRGEAGDAPEPSASRRDFTRRAATGVAAVAMLSNRPAWGNFQPGDCVSANAWASLSSGEVSMTPGRFETELELEEALRSEAESNPNLEFDDVTGCLIPVPPP